MITSVKASSKKGHGDFKIDPVTREIIQNALASAADEMAMALYRTAYSTIVRDCLDYSTSLCNAEGEMIAQGVTTPLHLGSIPFAMKSLFRKYKENMFPGDIFILEPKEVADPIFHEDCKIVCVKKPSIIGDKFEVL